MACETFIAIIVLVVVAVIVGIIVPAIEDELNRGSDCADSKFKCIKYGGDSTCYITLLPDGQGGFHEQELKCPRPPRNPCAINPCENETNCFTEYNYPLRNFNQSFHCDTTNILLSAKETCMIGLDGSYFGKNCISELKHYYHSGFSWMTVGSIEYVPHHHELNDLHRTYHILNVPIYNYTRVIYECTVNWSFNFMSGDASCEGQTYIKTLGYLYLKKRNNTHPLYRCASIINNDHYMLPSPCTMRKEKFEGLYGYYILNASIF